jgi:hypothetical protein
MSETPFADEDLVRMFEGTRSELPPEAFLQQLQRRMLRAKAASWAVRLGLLAALACAAWMAAPAVTRASLAAIAYAARSVPELALALSSPGGWIASLILGGWVLKRTHVFER